MSIFIKLENGKVNTRCLSPLFYKVKHRLNTNEYAFFVISTIIRIKMKEHGKTSIRTNGTIGMAVMLDSILTLDMHLSVIVLDGMLVGGVWLLTINRYKKKVKSSR